MKHLLIAVWVVAMLSLSGPVLAQEAEAEAEAGAEGEVQTRFYDFNEMLIDGEFMRPEGMFTRARDRARFQRLLDLRREFIDEIEESAKEDALE